MVEVMCLYTNNFLFIHQQPQKVSFYSYNCYSNTFHPFSGKLVSGYKNVYTPGYVKAYITVVIIFTLLSFILDNQGSLRICACLSSALGVIPVVSYSNADLEKKRIIKENKGKSGIYR